MIYTDGTIAIKAGSPIVTGTGTQWKKNIHGVAPGQLISIENGAAPVSMMIRAVNSDTELVLSFNAPVTLSGAKYSIATTVPDTISDAARTMSANQGYIVYFLQAMQQWMTDTSQVEIELPNGQKLTLDSIKALNEAIKKIDEKVDNIKIPEIKDATTTQKGIVQLSESVGTSTTTVPHEKAVKDWVQTMISYNPSNNTTVVKSTADSYIWFNGQGYFGYAYNGKNPFTFDPNNNLNLEGGIKVKSNGRYSSITLVGYGDNQFMWESNGGPGGGSYFVRRNSSGTNTAYAALPLIHGNGTLLGSSDSSLGSVYADGSGYVKKSSPIIQILPDGNYETNDESAGAEVSRTGTGQYHITGILGYNSDGAWGVNGGISVPKDNNGLELVYVDDRVLEDGSIIIETCHRQHAHLPERFQNWRLKEVTTEGERIFYQDGEPCDLPESTRLDVRVEMPQGSVWNVKQRELAEQMEREQAERVAQEAAEQGVDSDQ